MMSCLEGRDFYGEAQSKRRRKHLQEKRRTMGGSVHSRLPGGRQANLQERACQNAGRVREKVEGSHRHSEGNPCNGTHANDLYRGRVDRHLVRKLHQTEPPGDHPQSVRVVHQASHQALRRRGSAGETGLARLAKALQ